MSSPPTIAVVGATGAVGQEALDLLARRGHPSARVRALASGRSAGNRLAFGSGTVEARELTPQALLECEAALFCASAGIAREFAPAAVEAGVVVVDNSSAFRMAAEVPLVIPEVNGSLLSSSPAPRLVANPNCSTILLLTALEPVRRAFGLREVIVSTYQAASGAGQPAMDELRAQTRAVLAGEEPIPELFTEPYAFNVFIHETSIDPATGMCGEERKMVQESRRIWSTEAIGLFPTCVRVPVLRAHSQSVLCELERPADVEALRSTLTEAPGVRLVDDRENRRFPTPLAATRVDEVLVGHIRQIPGRDKHRFALWLSGDQLRKGAALNALQILDICLSERPR